MSKNLAFDFDKMVFNPVLVSLGSYNREDKEQLAWNIIKSFYYQESGSWWKKPEIAAYMFTPSNMVAMYMAKENNKCEPVEILVKASLVDPTNIKKPVDDNLICASVPDIYVKDVAARDYIYFTNWVVHAGKPNKNRDMWLEDDIREAINAGQLNSSKPSIIDINHQVYPAMGVTIDAYVTQDEVADAPGIVATSALFAWGPYKNFATYAVELAKKGELMFSVMCDPEYAECSVCAGMFKQESQYCEHLMHKEQYNAVRIVRHPKFYANSIIIPPNTPADVFARPLVLAGVISEDKINDVLVEGSIEMDPKVKEKLDELEAKVVSLSAEKEDLVKASKVAKDEYEAKVKELETSKTELSNKVAELQGVVEAKTNELTTVSAELEKANQNIKANETENRLNAVSAFLVNMDEDEKKLVRVEAETRDENGWASYTKILEKVAKTTFDPHIKASLGILPTAPADNKNEVFPNIANLLKK